MSDLTVKLTYSIIRPFLLSFIINDEQRDIIFNKNDNGYIETDGVTVWYVTTKERKRYESITSANVIEAGLNNKALQLCYVMDLEMITRKVSVEKIKLNFNVTPTGIEWNKDDG